MVALINEDIFPNNIEPGGLYCETIRVIAEEYEGTVTQRLVSAVGTL